MSFIQSTSKDIQELYRAAKHVRTHSYSPYSHCQVGAAIRISTGEIFTGCNVENASYGATVCAERVAIQKAVSERGKITITQILVTTDATPPWPPCGLCQQVIAEFTAPLHPNSETPTLIIANLQGEGKQLDWNLLFANAFTPELLNRNV
jgi:homotetrameric cytidine deaminase